MFDNEIKNKIFLITGVNGQIGSLLCETIIDRGGSVIGLDLEISKIQSLSKKKKWSSDSFLFLKTNISNEKNTKMNFNLGLKKFKKINFDRLEFYIPSDTVDYIEYIYGENWKIPQKKFSWWKIKNLKYE